MFHYLSILFQVPFNKSDSLEQPPEPRIIDNQPVYPIHKILSRQGNEIQYLIDWEGFGPEEQSCVPAKDILDILIKAQRTCGQPAPQPRGRPHLAPGMGTMSASTSMAVQSTSSNNTRRREITGVLISLTWTITDMIIKTPHKH